MENKSLENQGVSLTESTLKYIPVYALYHKYFISLFHETESPQFHVPDCSQGEPQNLRKPKIQYFSLKGWDLPACRSGISELGQKGYLELPCLPELESAKDSPLEPQEPREVQRSQQGKKRRHIY